jgi:hypothetical protein
MLRRLSVMSPPEVGQIAFAAVRLDLHVGVPRALDVSPQGCHMRRHCAPWATPPRRSATARTACGSRRRRGSVRYPSWRPASRGRLARGLICLKQAGCCRSPSPSRRPARSPRWTAHRSTAARGWASSRPRPSSEGNASIVSNTLWAPASSKRSAGVIPA